MLKDLKFLVISFILILALASCASKDKKIEDEVNKIPPVEDLYNKGMDEINKGEYQTSVKTLAQIQQEYPYSQWSTKAHLMTAYALYEDEFYDEAIDQLERYISLHPGSKDIGYAYYLKALCFYDRISTIKRDQEMTTQAGDSLQEVVLRFPGSDYAKDARLKLDLVADHLAGKELEIGRFYLKQNNILSAIKRYKKVLENYQTTSHTAEVLYRLVEAYVQLGVKEESQRYAAVLGFNYPGSRWYQYAYKLMTDKKIEVKKAQELKEKPSWWKGKWLEKKKVETK